MRSFNVALLVVVCCACIYASKLPTRGGLKDLTDTTELREIIDATLLQVANEYNLTFTLIEIIKAQRQTVSGTKYFAEVNLQTADDTRTCSFEIWDQPLTNFRHSTLRCPEKEYIVQQGQQSA